MPPESPRSTSHRSLLLGLSGAGLVALAGLCLVAVFAVAAVLYYLPQPAADEPAVAYVLDTSQRMSVPAEGGDGRSRLEVAEAVLAEAIRPAEPSLTSGMRVFGSGTDPDPCNDTDLLIPYARSNQSQIADEVSLLSAGSSTDAALAEAMVAAIRELSKYRGPHWMVVITGGADSCSPEAGKLIALEAERAGIELQTFVVGLQVTQSEAQAIKGMVDEAPGAEFLSAPDTGSLRAIIRAVQNYINAPSDLLRTAIAAAAGMPAAGYVPQTACDRPYWPMRVGATWTYVNGMTTTWTVTAATGDVTQARATIAATNASSDVQTTYEWKCSPEGLAQTRTIVGTTIHDVSTSTGVFFPSDDLLLPGYAWKYVATTTFISPISNEVVQSTAYIDSEVAALETVSTDAGSFEAIRVDSGISDGKSPNVSHMSFWYAYGVGLERNVNEEGLAAQLASYDIP